MFNTPTAPKEHTMSIFSNPRFLPRVMRADAASCAATGVLQLALAQPLAALLHLPAPLLQGTGAFLVGYAAVAAWLATRNPRAAFTRAAVGVIAMGNFGWAVGCIALLAAGGLAPTGWGIAWVLAQVATVVVLAELQWLGLRRTASRDGWPAAA